MPPAGIKGSPSATERAAAAYTRSVRGYVTFGMVTTVVVVVAQALPAPSPLAVASATAATKCAPVTFAGVADFRLTHIRATRVRCATARRVVRGARLHERWRSHGFACRVTGYRPEEATFYRCHKWGGRRIKFQAG